MVDAERAKVAGEPWRHIEPVFSEHSTLYRRAGLEPVLIMASSSSSTSRRERTVAGGITRHPHGHRPNAPRRSSRPRRSHARRCRPRTGRDSVLRSRLSLRARARAAASRSLRDPNAASVPRRSLARTVERPGRPDAVDPPDAPEAGAARSGACRSSTASSGAGRRGCVTRGCRRRDLDRDARRAAGSERGRLLHAGRRLTARAEGRGPDA